MRHPTKIFDAHHHLWNPVSQSPDVGYVWLKKIGAPKPFGDPTPIQRDYLLDEFLDETSIPIVGSVHVQADGAIPDPIAETAFIDTLCKKENFPTSIVGFVDLSKANAEADILKHKKFRSVVGVRQILSRLEENQAMSFAPEHYLHSPIWQENFKLLSENDLCFDLQLYPEQMADAADFFANYPEVPVIIDHAGSPYSNPNGAFENWHEGMRLLGGLKNISTKISGLGMFDLHLKGRRDAKPYIETMLEIFGLDRIMFGSNFPVDKLMSTYDEAIENIVRCLSTDSSADQWMQAIFHDNAHQIYSR